MCIVQLKVELFQELKLESFLMKNFNQILSSRDCEFQGLLKLILNYKYPKGCVRSFRFDTHRVRRNFVHSREQIRPSNGSNRLSMYSVMNYDGNRSKSLEMELLLRHISLVASYLGHSSMTISQTVDDNFQMDRECGGCWC